MFFLTCYLQLSGVQVKKIIGNRFIQLVSEVWPTSINSTQTASYSACWKVSLNICQFKFSYKLVKIYYQYLGSVRFAMLGNCGNGRAQVWLTRVDGWHGRLWLTSHTEIILLVLRCQYCVVCVELKIAGNDWAANGHQWIGMTFFKNSLVLSIF